MIQDRTAVEAVNYKPTVILREPVSLNQLVGDLRSYQTTIQLATEVLTERRLEGLQAERHLARIYEAIANSNEILSQIAARYDRF